jgi:hypothetical protein
MWKWVYSCNRVEQVVDFEHVGVGGLRSQLACDTITAVALRSER